MPLLARLERGLAAAWNARFGDAVISIFFEFAKPPYGGGNQFLLALKAELERQGTPVGVNYVGPRTRAILVNSMQVDEAFVKAHLRANVRVVHRVDGPISVYRGSEDAQVDRGIAALNQRLAHATVLQSRYSAEAHEKLGIAFVDPHVIPNAPDPAIFHPPPAPLPRAAKLRVISTAWSDNPNKGAATYAWLDRNLDFARIEYTFAGRIQGTFRNIRVVPPLGSEPLADLLRAHDVYLTASLHDPCSNALLEALACGLPAIHARSGGHAELAGEAGLGFDDAPEIPALLERMAADLAGMRSKIAIVSLSEVARRYRGLLLG